MLGYKTKHDGKLFVTDQSNADHAEIREAVVQNNALIFDTLTALYQKLVLGFGQNIGTDEEPYTLEEAEFKTAMAGLFYLLHERGVKTLNLYNKLTLDEFVEALRGYAKLNDDVPHQSKESKRLTEVTISEAGVKEESHTPTSVEQVIQTSPIDGRILDADGWQERVWSVVKDKYHGVTEDNIEITIVVQTADFIVIRVINKLNGDISDHDVITSHFIHNTTVDDYYLLTLAGINVPKPKSPTKLAILAINGEKNALNAVTTQQSIIRDALQEMLDRTMVTIARLASNPDLQRRYARRAGPIVKVLNPLLQVKVGKE